MNWLKTNLLAVILLMLFGLILFNTCSKDRSNTKQNTIDTTINNITTIYKIDTVFQPIIRETIPYEYNTSSVEYLPDSNVKLLIDEVRELKKQLFAINKYRDTVKVDSFGTAVLNETVNQNKITERQIKYDIKIPTNTVTITKTIYPHSKNKWFIGGGFGGSNVSLLNDVNAGFSLLSKKDQLYELKGRMDFKGNKYIELNTFWKIHF